MDKRDKGNVRTSKTYVVPNVCTEKRHYIEYNILMIFKAARPAA